MGDEVELGCDLDGDGLLDPVLSAPGAESGAGTAVVFSSATASTGPISKATATITGWSTSAAGGHPACAGDVDGDGQDDLWLGAAADSGGGDAAGGSWLFLGPLSGAVDLDDSVVAVLGEAGDQSWGVISAGDLDGDGLHDAWLAQPGHDEDRGRAGLLLTTELLD